MCPVEVVTHDSHCPASSASGKHHRCDEQRCAADEPGEGEVSHGALAVKAQGSVGPHSRQSQAQNLAERQVQDPLYTTGKLTYGHSSGSTLLTKLRGIGCALHWEDNEGDTKS